MDVFSSCGDDDVFDPPSDLKAAILTNVADVTSVKEPFYSESLEVLLLTIQVAHKDIATLDADIT